MILKASGLTAAYFYAQSLDNSGGSVCWRSDAPGEYEELNVDEMERGLVVHAIDSVQTDGRVWAIGGAGVDCKVTYQGDCLITIDPLTRDASGRIAPVVLLFDAYSEFRLNVAGMLGDCEFLMQRELSAQQLEFVGRLESLMRLPSLFIAFHILIYSRKSRHD